MLNTNLCNDFLVKHSVPDVNNCCLIQKLRPYRIVIGGGSDACINAIVPNYKIHIGWNAGIINVAGSRKLFRGNSGPFRDLFDSRKRVTADFKSTFLKLRILEPFFRRLEIVNPVIAIPVGMLFISRLPVRLHGPLRHHKAFRHWQAAFSAHSWKPQRRCCLAPGITSWPPQGKSQKLFGFFHKSSILSPPA